MVPYFKQKRTLKILEKSGKFVGLKKWEPCFSFNTYMSTNTHIHMQTRVNRTHVCAYVCSPMITVEVEGRCLRLLGLCIFLSESCVRCLRPAGVWNFYNVTLCMHRNIIEGCYHHAEGNTPMPQDLRFVLYVHLSPVNHIEIVIG